MRCTSSPLISVCRSYSKIPQMPHIILGLVPFPDFTSRCHFKIKISVALHHALQAELIQRMLPCRRTKLLAQLLIGCQAGKLPCERVDVSRCKEPSAATIFNEFRTAACVR